LKIPANTVIVTRKDEIIIETEELIPIVHNVIKYMTVRRDNKYLEIREISRKEYRDLANQILALLDKKEMSTTELKETLNSPKDIVAVISVMLDEMLILRGKPLKSWRDRRLYYAPFLKYFPNIKFEDYSESESTKLLIEKYVKRYGPVTEKDIVWWLGITKKKIQNALDTLQSEFEHIKINQIEHDYIIHKQDLEKIRSKDKYNQTAINILPGLDPYIMGYKDRERYVDYNYYEYVFDRSGNGTTTILVDGKVVGVWDIIEKPEPQIKLYLIREIEKSIMKKIEEEAKKIGKFITEKDVDIRKCKKMTPLTKRTMGGFMSPLKDC